jgi:hypothetical protein
VDLDVYFSWRLYCFTHKVLFPAKKVTPLLGFPAKKVIKGSFLAKISILFPAKKVRFLKDNDLDWA